MPWNPDAILQLADGARAPETAIMVMKERCGGVKQIDHHSRPKLALKFEVRGKSRWPFGWEILRELAGCTTAPPEPEPGRSPSASACGPYRDAIELGLSHGRNAMAIWQDLVDTCGFAAGYQSVRRFVTKLRGKQLPESCAVMLPSGPVIHTTCSQNPNRFEPF